jgi:CheY-like chemotaxis protein
VLECAGCSGSNVILLVDDEELVRRFAQKVLERAGYAVATAAGGDEALQTMRERAPDVLLTDIVMPGMSGLALAAQAHHAWPSLNVIFMSGFANQYEDELSGSVCLRKPFTASELLAAIEDLTGARRTIRTKP